MKGVVKKRILAAAAVVLVLMAVVVGTQVVQTQEGTKKFTVNVVDTRDGVNDTIKAKSTAGTLGEYMRESGDWQYEESSWGLYVQGYKEHMADDVNAYWWCLYIGDERADVGADEVPLEEGATYTWELTEGW